MAKAYNIGVKGLKVDVSLNIVEGLSVSVADIFTKPYTLTEFSGRNDPIRAEKSNPDVAYRKTASGIPYSYPLPQIFKLSISLLAGGDDERFLRILSEWIKNVAASSGVYLPSFTVTITKPNGDVEIYQNALLTDSPAGSSASGESFEDTTWVFESEGFIYVGSSQG